MFQTKLTMVKLAILTLLLFPAGLSYSQVNILDYKKNHSLTYENTIKAYQQLAEKFPAANMISGGQSDSGKELYLFTINGDHLDDTNRTVLMINNGIHPGEPCGIDACINFANDLLKSDDFEERTKNLVIGIIPIYNVGGSLNRGCCSRANQNGPEEYGFRGNARNLDLNRDFVKMDSQNAWIFSKFFHYLNPDVLVDTHTSNGSDYQYVMTLLTTQLDKLNPKLASLVKDDMLPQLNEQMDKKGYPMVPYVNSIKATPEHGIYDYLETPRYCTGYAALFNTIGFTTETHMWKPFAERVQSTYEFLKIIGNYCNINAATLIAKRKKAFDWDAKSREFALSWSLDTNRFDSIRFKGYEAEYFTSTVTGLETYRFNRDKPWDQKIRYYNRYNSINVASKPDYYVLPQAWKEVAERLKHNGVPLIVIPEDTTIQVTSYYIEDHKTGNRPYEGHYLHRDVKVRSEVQAINFNKGDYLINTDQKNIRFIMAMLEPHAVDSYFGWNFFDEILQQKEYFSHYIFEEKAARMLKEDEIMAHAFEEKKQLDPEFAKNHWAQLYWIYIRSDNYEPSHNRYPVFRIEP